MTTYFYPSFVRPAADDLLHKQDPSLAPPVEMDNQEEREGKTYQTLNGMVGMRRFGYRVKWVGHLADEWRGIRSKSSTMRRKELVIFIGKIPASQGY